ncbi:MAG: hypothetical protein N5P05_001778 [Chroococcopsis gigantea SAG 12.99]|nr:hypothetical protein [Chroococcopsis gigantea SAG 12.99]
MSNDPELYQHKEWLGLLQPVGLVVSPVALIKAGVVLNRSRAVELQQRLGPLLTREDTHWLAHFPAFAQQVLEWYPEDLIGAPGQEPLPPELEIGLPEYGEILAPTYAVLDPDTKGTIALVKILKPHLPLDEVDRDDAKWPVTPQAKFERLLRETGIPIGILGNGSEIRLVYAPRGESSGFLSFPISAMTEVAGRPILGALEMLLGSDRLFNLPSDRRLPQLLADSRNYQAEVSTKLAEQVLDALWELLRGFQMADVAVNGKLLGQLALDDPQHIYGGLITTLMRLVFLLYAEDEGLMPDDSIYQCNYSVGGLFERLREDAGNYPDTMDQRYGAWAWLLSLFRLVYDGGGATPEYLPARHGQLFDPEEYPFLCFIPSSSNERARGEVEIPRIPDGVIYRILEKLLILDGERLSYRALDVEQIGSVYEAIMGYTVEVAKSRSIGVNSKPKGSKHSTTIVIALEELLGTKPTQRSQWLKDKVNCELSAKGAKDLKVAKTVEEAIASLERKVSGRTPYILPAGALYLQPTEERRRSGSHYTPRGLTGPIVEAALKPVFEQLGDNLTAEQMLELKVCDLAMGSGAFLVEACRQLADKLVEAWNRESGVGGEVIQARRLVAQRCLYGVDKNPFATNLAKLSLWLVTLSKDLPFTFLDHALKCGDSLVGLTRSEIGSFAKDPLEGLPLIDLLRERVERVKGYRHQIQSLDTRTDEDTDEKVAQLQRADREIEEARLTGNLKIAAFFEGNNKKEREEKAGVYAQALRRWRNSALSANSSFDELREIVDIGFVPFNWEIEFPEVFDRPLGGFDCIVGNPPFAGKNTAINAHPEGYMDWLKEVHPESHGNSDLVAHFFRRAFTLLRKGGTFGLIATNTIAQGDTRSSGLRYICQNGGTIYQARKRVKWPGLAAVVVSIVHIQKNSPSNHPPSPSKERGQGGEVLLDGKPVSKITAFLFHAGEDDNPKTLLANAGKSFIGSYVLGMGFTFDDSNPDATPIAEMEKLIVKDPRNAERIFPYIGGEEVNSSPTHSHHRYVINFGDMREDEARQYPDLMAIVEEKVKPERLKNNRAAYRNYWWQYGEKRRELFKAIAPLDRVLVISCGATSHGSFTFLSSKMVFANTLAVLAFQNYSTFTILQSRIHENWARFFGSSMKDDLRYTPSDCFETFPFPHLTPEMEEKLENIGREYYEYRAGLMQKNGEGLTETYNRFHAPDESDDEILRLRELHGELDRAVLEAYGWSDIATDCQFLLDYEDLTPDPSPERRGESRKKPYRYRWPSEVHDEVLARLLELNQTRFDEEVRGGMKTRKRKG